jgi:hypothetical protein
MCVGIWLKRVDCLKVEAEVKLSELRTGVQKRIDSVSQQHIKCFHKAETG